MPCVSDLTDNTWHTGFYFQEVSKQTLRFNLWLINIPSWDAARPQASRVAHSFVWTECCFVPTHGPSLRASWARREGQRKPNCLGKSWDMRKQTPLVVVFFFFKHPFSPPFLCFCFCWSFFLIFFFFLVLNPGKNNLDELSSSDVLALVCWSHKLIWKGVAPPSTTLLPPLFSSSADHQGCY